MPKSHNKKLVVRVRRLRQNRVAPTSNNPNKSTTTKMETVAENVFNPLRRITRKLSRFLEKVETDKKREHCKNSLKTGGRFDENINENNEIKKKEIEKSSQFKVTSRGRILSTSYDKNSSMIELNEVIDTQENKENRSNKSEVEIILSSSSVEILQNDIEPRNNTKMNDEIAILENNKNENLSIIISSGSTIEETIEQIQDSLKEKCVVSDFNEIEYTTPLKYTKIPISSKSNSRSDTDTVAYNSELKDLQNNSETGNLFTLYNTPVQKEHQPTTSSSTRIDFIKSKKGNDKQFVEENKSERKNSALSIEEMQIKENEHTFSKSRSHAIVDTAESSKNLRDTVDAIELNKEIEVIKEVVDDKYEFNDTIYTKEYLENIEIPHDERSIGSKSTEEFNVDYGENKNILNIPPDMKKNSEVNHEDNLRESMIEKVREFFRKRQPPSSIPKKILKRQLPTEGAVEADITNKEQILCEQKLFNTPESYISELENDSSSSTLHILRVSNSKNFEDEREASKSLNINEADITDEGQILYKNELFITSESDNNTSELESDSSVEDDKELKNTQNKKNRSETISSSYSNISFAGQNDSGKNEDTTIQQMSTSEKNHKVKKDNLSASLIFVGRTPYKGKKENILSLNSSFTFNIPSVSNSKYFEDEPQGSKSLNINEVENDNKNKCSDNSLMGNPIEKIYFNETFISESNSEDSLSTNHNYKESYENKSDEKEEIKVDKMISYFTEKSENIKVKKSEGKKHNKEHDLNSLKSKKLKAKRVVKGAKYGKFLLKKQKMKYIQTKKNDDFEADEIMNESDDADADAYADKEDRNVLISEEYQLFEENSIPKCVRLKEKKNKPKKLVSNERKRQTNETNVNLIRRKRKRKLLQDEPISERDEKYKQNKNFIKTRIGIFCEEAISPISNKKKKLKMATVLELPIGTVYERSITRKLETSGAKEAKFGFRQSDATSRPLGVKVESILSTEQQNVPIQKKKKSLKRQDTLNEPTSVLPKPKWIAEKYSVSKIRVSEDDFNPLDVDELIGTEFSVAPLKSEKKCTKGYGQDPNIAAENCKDRASFNAEIKTGTAKPSM